MQKTIDLKTTCKNFGEILMNHKRFEILKEKHNPCVGDLIIFREYDRYDDCTLREIHARITHISRPASFRDNVIVGFDYALFYPVSDNLDFICIVL